ncbi:hypothetical protein DL96DRAFT_1643432 [Flagelloscypha sp. PMI_526]|nr:hypothetical protein DL96DRAFT_1643432 [Flagelloscypha sp. PMI_526]
MNNLPHEIFHAIFSFLDRNRDRGSLLSVSRVNTTLNHAAQPLLFSEISLYGYPHIVGPVANRLVTLLRSRQSHRICSWIQSLKIRIEYEWDIVALAQDDITAVVSMLPSLQVFEMSFPRCEWNILSRKFTDALTQNVFPHIRKLVIKDLDGFPIQVLANAASLKSLSLENVRISGSFQFGGISQSYADGKLPVNTFELDQMAVVQAVKPTNGLCQFLRDGTDFGKVRCLKLPSPKFDKVEDGLGYLMVLQSVRATLTTMLHPRFRYLTVGSILAVYGFGGLLLFFPSLAFALYVIDRRFLISHRVY